MCFARLWSALKSDRGLGAVNAMITNQRYQAPGRISRLMFRLMAGAPQVSYAGRVLGPAVNLLPEDRDDLPEVVPVEWLNTACTLYRREALPDPPFPAQFHGYSLMEDLTLSLTVGKRWQLANARTARIFHDSQPGIAQVRSSNSVGDAILNRHYVMTDMLGRTRIRRITASYRSWMAFSHLLQPARAARGWRTQWAEPPRRVARHSAILLRQMFAAYEHWRRSQSAFRPSGRHLTHNRAA